MRIRITHDGEELGKLSLPIVEGEGVSIEITRESGEILTIVADLNTADPDRIVVTTEPAPCLAKVSAG